jgi:hypothetical protein
MSSALIFVCVCWRWQSRRGAVSTTADSYCMKVMCESSRLMGGSACATPARRPPATSGARRGRIGKLTGLVPVGVDVVRATAVRGTFTAVGGGVDTWGREAGHGPDAPAEVDGLVGRGEVDGLGLLLDRPGCGEARAHGDRHAIAVRRRVLGTRCPAAHRSGFLMGFGGLWRWCAPGCPAYGDFTRYFISLQLAAAPPRALLLF